MNDYVPAKFKRGKNENEEEYICRVCESKDEIGTWGDVAKILNDELNYNYTESKYRKEFQYFNRMLEGNSKRFGEIGNNEELEKAVMKLRIEKQKVADQRRELNKLLTPQARFEALTEVLADSVAALNREKKLIAPEMEYDHEECESVVVFSDWHYGMTTDNIFNRYNTSICYRRVQEYIDYIVEKIQLHKPKMTHVILLGDMADGAIHVSSRVAAEERVCDQIIHISELIAESIDIISQYAPVKVHHTYGNHLRTVQNYKESDHSDNIEKLIPWWLEQRLMNNKSVEIMYDTSLYEFITFDCCGHAIYATHGDLDSINDVNTLNTLFDKSGLKTMDYFIMADKHHNQNIERMIDASIVGTLAGSDDYANKNRLYSYPSQSMFIFNRRGKDAVYNFRFSE